MTTTPTAAGANEYHAARLGKEAWEAQPEEKRQRALTTAIDDMSGYASSSGYEHAVYEQALWLIGDEAELARNGIESVKIGDISKDYDRGKRPANVAPKAWALVSGAGGAVKCGSIRTRPHPHRGMGRCFPWAL